MFPPGYINDHLGQTYSLTICLVECVFLPFQVRCIHRMTQKMGIPTARDHKLLTAAVPVDGKKGGLPRILSLAAERAKTWYRHPQKCHVPNRGNRQIRAERREAYQTIIETMPSFLDLASLCLGTATLDHAPDVKADFFRRTP